MTGEQPVPVTVNLDMAEAPNRRLFELQFAENSVPFAHIEVRWAPVMDERMALMLLSDAIAARLKVIG